MAQNSFHWRCNGGIPRRAVFFLVGYDVFFGVLGEYLGRTYFRVNDRVQTSVREVLNRNLQQSLDLEPRSAWENRFHDSSL